MGNACRLRATHPPFARARAALLQLRRCPRGDWCRPRDLRRRRDVAQRGTAARRARPHHRPAPTVRRRGRRGQLAGRPPRHGPRRALHERADRTGGRVRREQLPAGLLGAGRRHRVGACCRLSSRRQDPSGAPTHQRPRQRSVARRRGVLRPSRRRVPGGVRRHRRRDRPRRPPATAAVAFTGSLAAGRALFDRAAARSPIPVFAEMGSINPVFVLPGALRNRADDIASGLAQSVTLGVGQFCTNLASQSASTSTTSPACWRRVSATFQQGRCCTGHRRALPGRDRRARSDRRGRAAHRQRPRRYAGVGAVTTAAVFDDHGELARGLRPEPWSCRVGARPRCCRSPTGWGS